MNVAAQPGDLFVVNVPCKGFDKRDLPACDVYVHSFVMCISTLTLDVQIPYGGSIKHSDYARNVKKIHCMYKNSIIFINELNLKSI